MVDENTHKLKYMFCISSTGREITKLVWRHLSYGLPVVFKPGSRSEIPNSSLVVEYGSTMSLPIVTGAAAPPRPDATGLCVHGQQTACRAPGRARG